MSLPDLVAFGLENGKDPALVLFVLWFFDRRAKSAAQKICQVAEAFVKVANEGIKLHVNFPEASDEQQAVPVNLKVVE